eukprot:CAMPEP_0194766008 /NCGR_PEP_ID=MMETSP0323_2-20130528/27930_1 /TAXON_ID=2866 ORGANISM="Crypthecodinium cohnii, Strain Seligo" /NCGR_SAMPLE_ID=MMETSP0323_2 /ASSEMBLY_ACC=CAM_ASM_000346 /LENGTH=108 /DNA_ID=CAMNT_0039696475 /DNA_START=357 /DNA_END=684 /DNA_ORIENTATION=+
MKRISLQLGLPTDHVSTSSMGIDVGRSLLAGADCAFTAGAGVAVEPEVFAPVAATARLCLTPESSFACTCGAREALVGSWPFVTACLRRLRSAFAALRCWLSRQLMKT